MRVAILLFPPCTDHIPHATVYIFETHCHNTELSAFFSLPTTKLCNRNDFICFQLVSTLSSKDTIVSIPTVITLTRSLKVEEQLLI